jgi:hypothetical protein
MYEAINSSAATSRKAACARVERFMMAARMIGRTESSTVKSRPGRRTESARASSGNLH